MTTPYELDVLSAQCEFTAAELRDMAEVRRAYTMALRDPMVALEDLEDLADAVRILASPTGEITVPVRLILGLIDRAATAETMEKNDDTA